MIVSAEKEKKREDDENLNKSVRRSLIIAECMTKSNGSETGGSGGVTGKSQKEIKTL